jgi:predicted ATPase
MVLVSGPGEASARETRRPRRWPKPAGPGGAPFPDGAWFVDLAPLADSALAPAAVAQALGVREAAGRPLAAALGDHLREQRLLLVLDNCEHLLPGIAPEAAALVAAGPGVTLLATSREALRVAGEHEYPVPPLGLPPRPDPAHPPDRAALTQYEAVALFVERAVAAKPDFAVTHPAPVAPLPARAPGGGRSAPPRPPGGAPCSGG